MNVRKVQTKQADIIQIDDSTRKIISFPSIDRKIENRKIEEDRYISFLLLKQKFVGIVIIILTIFLCKSGLLYDNTIRGNDCTFAILSIPFGIWMIFTKYNVFYYPDNEDE